MAYTSMSTTSDGALLAPEQVADLLVVPVVEESIAAQVATVVTTGSTSYRIPYVAEDPAAAWVAEGAEIVPDNLDTDEVTVTPPKVAGLTVISRELAEDSDPAAAEQVGAGLARDIARKIDAAFFGSTTTNGPDGLESLTTSTASETGTEWKNADPFVAAVFTAAGEGATLTAFVANPADAKVLATLKAGTGSNVPLLQPDPTAPLRSIIAGVPLFVSSAVTAGTVWGIPKDRVFVVIRDDTRIEVDNSVYFTSDRVAVKATMRVGIGYPQPLAIVKINHGS